MTAGTWTLASQMHPPLQDITPAPDLGNRTGGGEEKNREKKRGPLRLGQEERQCPFPMQNPSHFPPGQDLVLQVRAREGTWGRGDQVDTDLEAGQGDILDVLMKSPL